MVYLVDTNVLVRLFTQDNEEMFREAFSFFEKVANFEIQAVISEGVLLESWFVLQKVYEMKKDEIIKRLLTIVTLRNVILEDKLAFIEALHILKERNIDFIDAMLCVKSNIKGYKVFSFDNDIQRCLKARNAV
ncbi:PIN domain-containing protein [Nitratiruptor sp. SB155-2]|uniref:PIN domain-containing protein n=1 Tax=Nitratiruptor sp. (strain SB155-2) TaxID=387092 RepID=UPI0001587224|nr:PIN domain-containing protein [Nitratiruptor sp. SB155-2]BAF70379.1 conserved hypothetical protein [Nitratiruptor sp. SB155-2]